MAIISGPGLTYAQTPLQEARLDSIPIVCLVFVRQHDPEKAFHTQQIDHLGIAKSVCKDVLEVFSLEELASTFDQAVTRANEGEPGPVVVFVESDLLGKKITQPASLIPQQSIPVLDENIVDEIRSRVQDKSVLLIAGRGCLACASDFRELAERLGAPVLTSTSARGVLSENHDHAVRSDLVPADLINQFIAQFDCILTMGIKFSENSTQGFRLKLPKDKLVHIDQGPHVSGRNFESQLSLVAHVPTLIKALLNTNLEARKYDIGQLADWRSQFEASLPTKHEPNIQGQSPPTAKRFFEVLATALPDETILVTDSGNHQMLARKHYVCRAPNGLLLPTNFQSMGFAVSTAMGAKLAQPDRPVVALIGDGGFQMSGLELAAAVRSKLNIVVIVFNDGHFGLIRNKQLAYDGFESDVSLPFLDIAGFADSISANYVHGSTDIVRAVDDAVHREGPTIIEIALDDSVGFRRQQVKSRAKGTLKRALGERIINLLK
jgi:acetolactate synthase-1/2/3 large subunit